MRTSHPHFAFRFASTLLVGALVLLLAVAASIAAWKFHYWVLGVSPWKYAGDYGYDADPALKLAMDGHLFSMFATNPPPLMMPFALLVRVPALVGGEVVGALNTTGVGKMGVSTGVEPNILARYTVGSISVLAFGAACAWMAMWQRSKRSALTATVFALALLFSPLTDDALKWGHPEEFLGTAMLLAALIALVRERYTTSVIFAVLAFATKQPFWLAAPVLLLMLPVDQRKRALLVAAATATVVFVPFLAPHLDTMLEQQTTQATAGAGASASGQGLQQNFWTAFGLTSLEGYARPLILLIAVALPLLVAARNRWRLSPMQGCAVLVVVLISRGVFDPFGITYYSTPVLAGLFALEWTAYRQGSHPLRRLPVHVPVFALLGASLLSGAHAPGYIADFVNWAHLGDASAPLYATVAFALMAVMLPFIIGDGFDRARARLYGGGVAVAALLAAAVLLFGQETKVRKPIAPPPGFTYAAQLTDIVNAAAPVVPYWLGPEDIASNFLRSRGARKPTNGSALRAVFDYGQTEDTQSVTVFTRELEDRAAMTDQLNACLDGACPAGSTVVDSPLGPALVTSGTNNQWEAQMLTPTGAVFVSSTASDVTPHEALARLRPLTRADALSSQQAADATLDVVEPDSSVFEGLTK